MRLARVTAEPEAEELQGTTEQSSKNNYRDEQKAQIAEFCPLPYSASPGGFTVGAS